jgi:hypothetical protein
LYRSVKFWSSSSVQPDRDVLMFNSEWMRENISRICGAMDASIWFMAFWAEAFIAITRCSSSGTARTT